MKVPQVEARLPGQSGIYRVGGPTHTQWIKELSSARRLIREADALIVDPEDAWTGVDPSKLEGLKVCGVDFIDYYQGLVQTGWFHGWIN